MHAAYFTLHRKSCAEQNLSQLTPTRFQAAFRTEAALL